MALDFFGIKEVADVRFYPAGSVVYEIDEGTKAPHLYPTLEPVLEFTTLKVSNLEFTAEQTDARGGKGNLILMSWDHSREANLTLEDALLSMKSLKAMFGDNDFTTKHITIGGSSFPGNYTIVGTTYAKNQETGDDHLFTFYVPNAKMGAEVSLSMEADGDPTVFSMPMKALRASTGDDTLVALIAQNTAYAGNRNGKDLLDASVETGEYFRVELVGGSSAGVYLVKNKGSVTLKGDDTVNNYKDEEQNTLPATITANGVYTYTTT